MTVYTVHEPPLRKGEASANPERFEFVRDGFYFWAFLLGPFWMLWRRLWLVLFLYLVLWAALEAGLWLTRTGSGGQFLALLVVALLVGLEASTLRRWTLTRNGWTNVGVVVGDDAESAERRFFSAWNERPQTAAKAAPKPAPLTNYGPKPESGVIGLFPEPGGRR
jgi:hypothetical protein